MVISWGCYTEKRMVREEKCKRKRVRDNYLCGNQMGSQESQNIIESQRGISWRYVSEIMELGGIPIFWVEAHFSPLWSAHFQSIQSLHWTCHGCSYCCVQGWSAWPVSSSRIAAVDSWCGVSPCADWPDCPRGLRNPAHRLVPTVGYSWIEDYQKKMPRALATRILSIWGCRYSTRSER